MGPSVAQYGWIFYAVVIVVVIAAVAAVAFWLDRRKQRAKKLEESRPTRQL